MAGSGSSYQCLVYIMSLGFFLVFAAFNTAQALASSLKGPKGITPVTFGSLYLTFCLLCIPAPKYVATIGPKMSMLLGGLPYVGLVLSFLAPELCAEDGSNAGNCWSNASLWALKVPLAVLVGAGAPFIWTGQGVYIGRLAALAARSASADAGAPSNSSRSVNSVSGIEEGQSTSTHLLANDGAAPSDDVVGQMNKRFNGIFFSAFQFSGAAGTLASSLILTLVPDHRAAVHVLFWVLSVCCIIGLLVIGLALPRLKETSNNSGGGKKDSDVTLWETLRLAFTDARMYLVVPNILYNGMSLGFVFSVYTSLGWNTTLGASFVGFGTAFFYLINTFCTGLTARLSGKIGQLPTMVLATASQAVFYIIFIVYHPADAECLTSGCIPGTVGSCFAVPHDPNEATLPKDCILNSTEVCALCVPYDGATHSCAAEEYQCQWLHGDIVSPRTFDVVMLFIGAALFAIGDAVWEGQVPAVLQTLFESKSGKQPSALANLKLWQSLGFAIMFGLEYLHNLRACCIVLVISLFASSVALFYNHTRVASFDNGKRRDVASRG